MAVGGAVALGVWCVWAEQPKKQLKDNNQNVQAWGRMKDTPVEQPKEQLKEHPVEQPTERLKEGPGVIQITTRPHMAPC